LFNGVVHIRYGGSHVLNGLLLSFLPWKQKNENFFLFSTTPLSPLSNIVQCTLFRYTQTL
jgi:hypothetical protein